MSKQDSKPLFVPWTGEGHPFAIMTGPNPSMRQWDLVIQFGAFKTQAEAKEYADALVEHLRAWPPFKNCERVQ